MAHRTKLALMLAPVALVGTAVAAQSDGGTKFRATLTGANQVPPTTETATGIAIVRINAGQRRVCWEIATSGFTPPPAGTDQITATHIHSGLAGANGDVVVFLAATLNGTNKGCTSAMGGGNNTPLSEALIDSIRKSPEAFYVNVHTTEFPNGAIRGQLSK